MCIEFQNPKILKIELSPIISSTFKLYSFSTKTFEPLDKPLFKYILGKAKKIFIGNFKFSVKLKLKNFEYLKTIIYENMYLAIVKIIIKCCGIIIFISILAKMERF